MKYEYNCNQSKSLLRQHIKEFWEGNAQRNENWWFFDDWTLISLQNIVDGARRGYF